MEVDFSVRGEIVEWDKENDSIHLLQANGTVLEIYFDRFKYTDVVWDAFNGYDNNNGIFRRKHLVLVRGKKESNPEQNSTDKETYTATFIKPINALCPIYRLEQLEMVEDDWDRGDGEGIKAPTKEDIEWLKGFFIKHYPDDLCLPYLTIGDGSFFLEWVKPGCDWEATFDIEYGTHIADGYIENRKGKDELENGELVEEDMRCDLNNEEEIKSWIEMLRVMGGRETA